MILVERHWNRALGVLLATTTLLGGCGAGGGSAGGGGDQPAPGGGSTGVDPAGADAGGGSATGGAGGTGTPGGTGGAAGTGGAGAGGAVAPGEPDCLDNDTFFVRKVWRETLRPVCSTCHSANGAASNTRMVFVPEGAPEWQLRNLQAFEGVATLQMDGVPLVLLKPSGEVAHGGGAVLTADAPGRAAVEEMITRLADPEAHACAATADVPTTWAGVESLSPAETLRKATLFFGSRLPTDAELALVDANGLAGLEPALDAVLHEDAFYEWLRWATNDLLLTDKFLGSRRAVDAIDDDRYPEARWYLEEGVDPGTGLDAAWFRAAQTFTNDSIAREPVELVLHLLRNDRPITEMLTADYTVVNPFSARAYGLQDTVQFEDRFDPRVFVEARLPGVPHAGVLSTPVFMTRYPTTATNRNRARARVVYANFLATNVLELAQRPISAVSPIHNPTLNDPQCNVCHSVIDPVAGALQNWNARGGYEVLDAWYPEMTPPGFGDEMLPQEARTEGASWLAERIVADRRFDRAIVRWMFKAIVGSAVRSDPGAPPPGMEEDPVFLARVAAFEAQTDALTRLERELRANGHDLRVLIKSIVRSPWFRAERVADPENVPPAAALPDVGVGRILAPEHLSRRIQAITGLPWRPRADAVDYLLDVSQYKLLYGGLDSDDVTERTTEPNALMAAIQARMATDMACLLVTQEFARAPELRRLFTGVEPSFRPLDTNGFEVPQARVALRATLQRLHWALLGERLADDAPQLDQTWALFNDTWSENLAAMASGELSANLQDNCRATRDYRTGVDLPQERRLTQDPNGTIRAWQAVVQALLSDFRFLHE
jgi:hypothetical protein